MNHSCSLPERQAVCSVHVAYDYLYIVSVHNVRDSGVVNVEVLSCKSIGHCDKCHQVWDSVSLWFTVYRVGRRMVQSGLLKQSWPKG